MNMTHLSRPNAPWGELLGWKSCKGFAYVSLSLRHCQIPLVEVKCLSLCLFHKWASPPICKICCPCADMKGTASAAGRKGEDRKEQVRRLFHELELKFQQCRARLTRIRVLCKHAHSDWCASWTMAVHNSDVIHAYNLLVGSEYFLFIYIWINSFHVGPWHLESQNLWCNSIMSIHCLCTPIVSVARMNICEPGSFKMTWIR